MQNTIPQLKLLSDSKIPRLGLGTWLIGGDHTGRLPDNDDIGQIKSIKYALDLGYSAVRTAHNYAEGYCEKLVGQAIKDHDRNNLYMITAANQKFATDEKSLLEIAEGSLKNLNIDHFDLFLIGAINPEVSLQKILDGLKKLKTLGITKDIGVSNFRLPELQAAYDYLGKDLVYNEMHYNLIIREPQICGALDFCREKGIILGAYRPLQLGQLSKPGIQILDEIANKYNKSQSQVALRWLIQQQGVTTMAKAINTKHLEENIKIFDWELSQEDFDTLTNDFPIQIRTSDCSEPRKFKF